jgi:hypothetical protein
MIHTISEKSVLVAEHVEAKKTHLVAGIKHSIFSDEFDENKLCKLIRVGNLIEH